jgi:hypothetical protein
VRLAFPTGITFWSVLWEKIACYREKKLRKASFFPQNYLFRGFYGKNSCSKTKTELQKVKIHKNISHRKQLFYFPMGNISPTPPKKGVFYKKKSHRNTLFKFSVGKINA